MVVLDSGPGSGAGTLRISTGPDFMKAVNEADPSYHPDRDSDRELEENPPVMRRSDANSPISAPPFAVSLPPGAGSNRVGTGVSTRGHRGQGSAGVARADRCWRFLSQTGRLSLAAPLACLFFVLGAAPAEAESESMTAHDGELGRWVVSGALEIGIFGHTGKGNVNSTNVDNRPGFRVSPINPNAGDETTLPVIATDASREEILSALIGGDFEIMSPALFEGPTHPRLFLDVNVSETLTNDVGLAREGDPGVLGLPTFGVVGGQVVGERAVVGRGNKTTVQHQGPQVHAGLGTALTFDFGPERIRIKPSVVYSRIIVDVFSVARRAVRLNNNIGAARTYDNTFRSIELSDKQREVYHGIGPAIEIEYETRNRIGPFAVTLFAKAHASHLLGDLKTRFEQTNTQDGAMGETVRWKYSQDRWVYKATTGFRLRLVPKRRR